MTTTLTPKEIRANEKFFDSVMLILKDGYMYGWSSEQLIFTKYRGVLIAESRYAYDRVGRIVTPEYLERYFKIKQI